METKTIIWIVLGVLGFLILVVGGCVVGGVLFIKSNVDTISEAATAESAEEAIAVCNEKSGITKNTCLLTIATLYVNVTGYNDARLCDAIGAEEYQFGCRVMYAGYWEDESLCSGMQLMEVPDGKLMCQAAARNDPALCGQISSAEVKRSCLEFVNNDIKEIKNEI